MLNRAFATLVLVGIAAFPGTARRPRTARDFDAPILEAAKAALVNARADPGTRVNAMRELVARNATAARALIPHALGDPSLVVQRGAAEWLAIFGDRRGLDWQAGCLEDPTCPEIRYNAVRLLGNSRDPRYAAAIRSRVIRILGSGRRGRSWDGTAENRAMLKYGAIALSRIGLREDQDLVLEVVEARPSGDPAFLEALGYIDTRRSREILWSAWKSLSRTPTCSRDGLGVWALLPLSRLGEERAIDALEDVLRGIGTPPDPWEGTFPSLCADRAQAFDGLRARDARNFAETLLQIAAKEPEGPGTFAAWNALGRIRPEGFARRVLKLAISRPRWQLVSHHMLNTVVVALDPDLHDEFWEAYEDVQEVPLQLGIRTQVKEGLGYLLFSGTGKWTGD